MRTAVFGGSFDPPHRGHRELALAALVFARAEKILFVPAWRPPHKPGLLVAPFQERLAMLRLALEGETRFEISDIEARREVSPSYSFEMMLALAGERPSEELCLLMGSDSLRQLHTWHRASELVERWPLIVYPRPGDSVALGELEKNWMPATARKLVDSLISGVPEFPVSSTRLREALSEGKDCGDLLAPAVSDYIRQRKLYSGFTG